MIQLDGGGGGGISHFPSFLDSTPDRHLLESEAGSEAKQSGCLSTQYVSSRACHGTVKLLYYPRGLTKPGGLSQAGG